MAIEEHGGGKQLIRFRCTTKYSTTGQILLGLLTILAIIAAMDKAYSVSIVWYRLPSITLVNFFTNTSWAMLAFKEALDSLVETIPTVTAYPAGQIVLKRELHVIEEEQAVQLPGGLILLVLPESSLTGSMD